MEGLLNVQSVLQSSIERGLTNFTKSPKSRITLEYVEIRTDNLEKDWSQFRENNVKLILMYSKELDQTVYILNDVYSSVEEIYIEYKSLLKVAFKKLSVSECSTVSDKNSNSFSRVRLPEITIPCFSGKYSEWTTFYDLFSSLVHKNSSIDNVQKMHYLKGHLLGEAEQLVRHIPITEDNYVQCWELLKNRYSNKKYLVNCILNRFFGQNRVYNESASSLKEILDTTTECINALKGLKIDVSTWDIIIIHVVSFKLDPETRKQWEVTISSDSSGELPTLDQFKSFLECRFRALEFIEPNRFQGQPNSSHIQQSHPKVMLTAHSDSSKTYSRSNMSCEFCGDQHKLCFCKKFVQLDINQRRDFVLNNNICFNCLGGNHRVKECQKSTSCHTCNKRHHTLLHFNSSSSSQAQGQMVRTNSSEDISPSNGNVPIISCVSTRQSIKSRQVLLPTALIKAEASSGAFRVLRALLDQGSQATFVTEDTVHRLRLKKTPVRGIVSGLGADKITVSKYMVTLKLQSLIESNFEIKVNAYVLKNITANIPGRNVERVKWGELDQLKLADPEFNNCNKIDLLLGAEVYSQIIKEGVKRSPNKSLLAQCTSLGWIISGEVVPQNNKKEISTNKMTVMHIQINKNDMFEKFQESVHNNKTLTLGKQRGAEIYAGNMKRSVYR